MIQKSDCASRVVQGRGGSSVVSSVTVGLEEFIHRQGGESKQVLSRAGLPSHSYENPNQHIPLKRYLDSLHEAARSTGNDHFGLWFGEQFEPEGLGILGFFATTSPDLGAALTGMQQYFHVFQLNSLLNLKVHQGICELEYRLLDGDIMDRRQDAEVTIGMLNSVLKRAMGETWSPLDVSFQHPALTNDREHKAAFHCDVHFHRDTNVIRFREACLSKAMPNADPMLNHVLRGSLEQMSGTHINELSLVQRVRSEIIELLPSGDIAIGSVCSRLNMSQRSLQRRLADENHSFKMMVDEVRQALAVRYLTYPSLSVSEIAYRLGYSEVSAFTRAFVRWKNLSPSDWRSA